MRTHLKAGQPAPEFDLLDADGKTHRLKDYRGKKLLIYFYPRDNTPGCIAQASEIRDHITEYVKRYVNILGISTDTSEIHKQFTADFGLCFPLLADPTASTVKAYGVLNRWIPFWKLARRTSFLIDEKGIILKIWDPASRSKHTSVVLNYIDEAKLS